MFTLRSVYHPQSEVCATAGVLCHRKCEHNRVMVLKADRSDKSVMNTPIRWFIILQSATTLKALTGEAQCKVFLRNLGPWHSWWIILQHSTTMRDCLENRFRDPEAKHNGWNSLRALRSGTGPTNRHLTLQPTGTGNIPVLHTSAQPCRSRFPCLEESELFFGGGIH